MIRAAWKRIVPFSALALSALGMQGCYTYSAFQGARVLDEGRYSVSPSASVVSFSNDGNSDWISTQFGARGAMGMGNKLELQARYERVEPHDAPESGWGYGYLDLGFKYGIIKDRVAVGMPVGFMFGDRIEEGRSWQVHPSLYLTLPANRYLDFNVSTTGIYFLNDSDDRFLWAFNGGLGIRLAEGRFTLLPEAGILTNPGEDGHMWHWGMGAAMEF